MPWHILAPRAVACDDLHLRASVHLWHVSAFLCNGEFLGISRYIKKTRHVSIPGVLSEFWVFQEKVDMKVSAFSFTTSLLVFGYL